MKTISDYLECVLMHPGYPAYWFPRTFTGLKMCALAYDMIYEGDYK